MRRLMKPLTTAEQAEFEEMEVREAEYGLE